MLWEQCQIFIEWSSPRYYVCGQDVNGNAVSSVARCLELRQLTGRTKQFCGALKAPMRFKRDPRFLRTVVQGSYWPTTAAQWKFWKDALFWVYEQIWGMSNLPLMYVVRVQWVEREYREAVNKERREGMRL